LLNATKFCSSNSRRKIFCKLKHCYSLVVVTKAGGSTATAKPKQQQQRQISEDAAKRDRKQHGYKCGCHEVLHDSVHIFSSTAFRLRDGLLLGDLILFVLACCWLLLLFLSWRVWFRFFQDIICKFGELLIFLFHVGA